MRLRRLRNGLLFAVHRDDNDDEDDVDDDDDSCKGHVYQVPLNMLLSLFSLRS